MFRSFSGNETTNPKNLPSGGNRFKDFTENQLAEFCALVTTGIGKANWEHGFLNHWYSIV